MTRTKRAAGVITVFMTFVSALMLSLAGVLIDSARIRGASAQAAYITEMGNLSIFGEFERSLLEEYEVFGLDGSRGTGDFSPGRIEDRLRTYLQANASPDAEGLAAIGFDPWKLRLRGQEITGYALLTDGSGEAFYRQVVEYMQETAAAQGLGALRDLLRDAEELEEKGEAYEKAEKEGDADLKAAQEAAAAAVESQDQKETAAGQEPKENPLDKIGWLHRADPVILLTGKHGVPENAVSGAQLCFHRPRNRGTMALPGRQRGGPGNAGTDLLFKEYLLARFPCYTDGKRSLPLSCQLEYFLHGATSDKANLRWAILKLLALREGANYAYLVSSPDKSGVADLLAAGVLTVFDTVPGLHAALKHALLLGWAFGESLLDVKTLLDDGSVPLEKTDGTFLLHLENLGQLGSLLSGDLGGRKEGLDYKEHLRLLLYLQPAAAQCRRALEMIELNLRNGGAENFRADNCIAAARIKTAWTVPPLFMRIASAFAGTGSTPFDLEAGGTFMY